MSTTSFGLNDPKAVKLWSKKVFTEALKKAWASRFIGTSDNSVVQILTDTKKGAGDTITVPLRLQLTGDGTLGDATLEGNEEALSYYNDKIIINQFRHATVSAGKMSEQRVPFNVREQAKNALTDYFSGRIDFWFFNQLGGNTAVTDVRYTGLQAAIAPDTNHRLWSNSGVSADEGLGSSDVFNLTLIDKCVERAQTLDATVAAGCVPIRPVKVEGEDKYLMFLHPYQVVDLRTNAGTGQWLDIQKAAAQGGQVTKNPIYTGALGEYNGVVLHNAPRVCTGVNSTTGAAVANVRRAIFCGAQAGIMAFGQDNGPDKMTWKEEMFDYGNQLGVSAGMIAGIKKAQFNSTDFGVITVSTYAAKHN